MLLWLAQVTTPEAEALAVHEQRCVRPTSAVRQIVTPGEARCTERRVAKWEDRIARIPTGTALAHPCKQIGPVRLRLAASGVPNSPFVAYLRCGEITSGSTRYEADRGAADC